MNGRKVARGLVFSGMLTLGTTCAIEGYNVFQELTNPNYTYKYNSTLPIAALAGVAAAGIGIGYIMSKDMKLL